MHGYEFIERVPEEVAGEDVRVDVGNLYRILRALEDEGIVTSEWSADLPGPAKRTYQLTDAGNRLLDRWAAALGEARQVIGASSTATRAEGGERMHGRRGHHGWKHFGHGFRRHRFRTGSSGWSRSRSTSVTWSRKSPGRGRPDPPPEGAAVGDGDRLRATRKRGRAPASRSWTRARHSSPVLGRPENHSARLLRPW